MKNDREIFQRNRQKLNNLVSRSRGIFERLNVKMDDELCLMPVEDYRIFILEDSCQGNSEGIQEEKDLHYNLEIGSLNEFLGDGISITSTCVNAEKIDDRMDLAVFMISLKNSLFELESIDKCLELMKTKNIIFVFRDFDRNEEDKWQDTIKVLTERLQNKTGFGAEGICFIDNSDLSVIKNMIMQEFMKSRFYKPLYELTRNVREVMQKIVAGLYVVAEKNGQNAELIYNRAISAIKRAAVQKGNITEKSNSFLEIIEAETEALGKKLINSLIIGTSEYIENNKIDNEILPFIIEDNIIKIDSEFYKGIEEYIEIELYMWAKKNVMPTIDSLLIKAVKGMENNFRSFYYEADTIARDFKKVGGLMQPAERILPSTEKVWELMKITYPGEDKGCLQTLNENILRRAVFNKSIFFITIEELEGLVDTSKMDGYNWRSEISKAAVRCIDRNSKDVSAKIIQEIVAIADLLLKDIESKINNEIEVIQGKVQLLRGYKNRLQDAIEVISQCEKELREIDDEIAQLTLEAIE